MNIFKTLPAHVELSPRLKEASQFYIGFQMFGRMFYIAGTKEVQKLFELDANGNFKGKWRRESQNEDALRDIANSLQLQVRDDVMAGVESNVKNELLRRMDELMTPRVRQMIRDASPPELTDGD